MNGVIVFGMGQSVLAPPNNNTVAKLRIQFVLIITRKYKLVLSPENTNFRKYTFVFSVTRKYTFVLSPENTNCRKYKFVFLNTIFVEKYKFCINNTKFVLIIQLYYY